MSALLLAIKKLIAVLTAFFIPTATAAPAIVPQYSRTVTVSIFDTVKEEENEAPYIEEDEQLEPVAEWDVSATENDDVSMYFYDTEDADSVLEQLAGRVTALFAPMTAYAATRVDFEELPDEGGDGEFGPTREGGAPVDENAPIKGTVVVSGTGEMIDSVYNMFIDPLRYLNTTVELFANEGITVACEYNGETDIEKIAAAATDIIELDANVVWTDTNTGEQVYPSEEMTDALNPVNFLKYSPVTLIIADGVTSISDYAFIFCGDIDEVIMPDTVTEIGQFAFAYCTNLERVTFSSALTTIEANAFDYTALDNVVIPASVTYIEHEAFRNIKAGATIVMPNQELKDYFERFNSDMNYNVVLADTAIAA